jgi:hypothetical protein
MSEQISIEQAAARLGMLAESTQEWVKEGKLAG